MTLKASLAVIQKFKHNRVFASIPHASISHAYRVEFARQSQTGAWLHLLRHIGVLGCRRPLRRVGCAVVWHRLYVLLKAICPPRPTTYSALNLSQNFNSSIIFLSLSITPCHEQVRKCTTRPASRLARRVVSNIMLASDITLSHGPVRRPHIALQFTYLSNVVLILTAPHLATRYSLLPLLFQRWTSSTTKGSRSYRRTAPSTRSAAVGAAGAPLMATKSSPSRKVPRPSWTA